MLFDVIGYLSWEMNISFSCATKQNRPRFSSVHMIITVFFDHAPRVKADRSDHLDRNMSLELTENPTVMSSVRPSRTAATQLFPAPSKGRWADCQNCSRTVLH